MKQARVLVVGLRGVSSEVCKNLVLAGVQQVTLLDAAPVEAPQLAAHLFLSAADIGRRSRAEASVAGLAALNPLVDVRAEQRPPPGLAALLSLSQPPAVDAAGGAAAAAVAGAAADATAAADVEDGAAAVYLSQFGVVVASHLPLGALVRLDALCRRQGIRFFAVDSFGYAGYFFSDLGVYHHQPKPSPSAAASSAPSTSSTAVAAAALVTVHSASLAEAAEAQWAKKRPNLTLLAVLALLELWSDDCVSRRDPDAFVAAVGSILARRGLRSDLLSADLLRPLVSHCEAELAPVGAIIGGLLAQEIIKIIAGKEEPLGAFFLYNAMDAKNPGMVEA